LPEGWTNILLLGGDSRSANSYGRSDAIIIASVNNQTGEMKLTSIMRDTWVKIPLKGENKINAAMAFGGPKLAMKTINSVFDMNITKYAIVDFVGFPFIIDKIGGIEIDIDQKEMSYINITMGDLNKKNYPGSTDFSQLKKWGKNTHLTGIQALSYARIRHMDSDFQRTQRQRNVLMGMFKKVKSKGMSFNLVTSAAAILPSVETNLDMGEILALGEIVMKSNLNTLKELRLPVDGTYKDGIYKDTYSIRPDFKKNTQQLHDFIYGK